MNNHLALDPRHSIVVEACAGSGKTWLLVSRIVRLLLAEVKPGEILAITFTRKAAQEMQARLHEWLHLLAVGDDATIRGFLRERGLDAIDDALLEKARGLYRDFLLAQPGITISTFHGWFMQIIQRAPLNAGVPVGMSLLERTTALREEAWQAFADSLRAAPESAAAQSMQWLFARYGLHSTRALLENFVHKRAEWWAYTATLSPGPSPASGRGEHESAGEGAVDWALEQLRDELDVDANADPAVDWGHDNNKEMLFKFTTQLACNGTGPQQAKASELEQAWTDSKPDERFSRLWPLLFTLKDEPRIGSPFKPTTKQQEDAFILPRDALQASLLAVHDALTEQEALRMNAAALRCGAALLEHYQELKLRAQQMDFTDLEWQVCRVLNQGECAEYMQYKLDSRYRHVLLDEFQDTNPLQWQILQSWFAAAAAVESRPTVFVVGDPKQSIYRFRRADARLFGEVREFLQHEFNAHFLTQNITRRNSPAVLNAVNGVFRSLPDGFVDFEEHAAHQSELPGHVEVLPLAVMEKPEPAEIADAFLTLRNPLTEPRAEAASGARELEAEQFATQVADLVANWSIQEEGVGLRRAEYRDIMVLVRKRTHLRVYEHALRMRHIPFLTSRRGGLLDTLEAEDIQALLTFLITPFADLELAQALRSPLFACSDDDLMQLAQDAEGGWWMRLQRCALNGSASAGLMRAHTLLQSWLSLADKLPVHDLLDRIYFEGDLAHRYAAALPAELRETVHANLQAFMEIALNVDAGRYPSLPRFLAELRELRAAENEAPDEGKVGKIDNALRIYTVHESKGLEAPIVWLLDANDTQRQTDSYGVLLDWPSNAPQPLHFSLYTDKRGRGARRAHYFKAEEEYAKREEMNLLYVAMTRAKQALLVSGSGEADDASWHGRIAAALAPHDNPLRVAASVITFPVAENRAITGSDALQFAIPTGKRTAHSTTEQRRGTWLHALLQHLAPPNTISDRSQLQARCGIPADAMDALWQQAQHLLAQAHLQRYFDPRHYRAACNEIPYIDARGELKRIDRLVEFDNEVWVLDYKTGESADPAQLMEYRDAMRAIYAGKEVRCALLFMDGTLDEIQ
ncbi:MAG: UvrD-helicase domain-containing protein [Nitrosomonadales bacterium]|nr:UvrD-helicase domain-containing protein [Nitrosomonadales bacterium]